MSDFDGLSKKDIEKYKRRDKKYANRGTNPRDIFEQDSLTGIKIRGEELEYLQLQHKMLNEVVFIDCNLHHSNFQHAKIQDCQFINCNVSTVEFSDCEFAGVDFKNCNLPRSTFRRANVLRSKFTNANLSKTRMQKAFFDGCQFEGANFSQANLYQAEIHNSSLDFARFVETNFYDTFISNCTVFGSSVWKCNTKNSEQINLAITPASENPENHVYVDNIKVAQFIYLILNNEEIRDVINTLTSVSVLILGRFSDPERKAVLEGLRNKLRDYGLLPIVFDFERPTDRDFTETIKVLAGLSYFVISDVSNPKSSPLELQATVPDYQIPFVPIIQEGESPFAMMANLQTKYSWVLDTISYDSLETLLGILKPNIIDPALKMRDRLRLIKAKEPTVISGRQLKQKKA